MIAAVEVPLYRPRWLPELRRAGSEDSNSLPEAEEWRDLDGYELAYQVSSVGRVRSPRLSGYHILRPGFTHDGYAYVMLKRDGRMRISYVHRLVCEAWHGPRPGENMQAAHLDGYQGNNRPENLAWATPSENNLHKAAHGNRSPKAKLTDDAVLQAVHLLRSGVTQREVGQRLGVSRQTISGIASGREWSHLTGIQRKAAIR